MGKGMVLFGDAAAGSPTPATAEDAAFEYHVNRRIMGDWTPRPPIERWRPLEREKFLTELERLEAEERSNTERAAEFVARRGA
jgi:hypothetical protein